MLQQKKLATLAIVFFITSVFFNFAAAADTVHAIAMHGTPRYSADFKNMDYVNPNAPKGGDLKLSKNGSFNNLNAHIITGNNVEGLELINDKLMQRAWNEPFTLYGLVAEKVDVSSDRSSITFYLNKSARFHDGTSMTTEDVKYSYEMYRQYGHPVRRRVYGLVDSVTIIDPHTIKFHFGKGYDRESVMILAMMPVLPKHYWEKHDFQKTTLNPPLGSGPYKIKSVDPGRKIVYERVKDYWAKDLPINKGLYNFDTVTYNYYRDDTIALEAFKAGNYNLRREYDIKKWKTAYNYPATESGEVKVESIPHQRPEWLKALIFNTRRPMFQDVRVRQALGLLFNYDWINKNLFYGVYKPIESAFPNSELSAHAWKAPSSQDERANVRTANELLRKAGWSYKDEKLVDRDGHPFEFEILLGEPADEKIALEYTRGLKRIGVNARVRSVDNAQFTGRLQDFDYDMVSFKWINTLSPGNEQVNYWGSAAADTRGSRNYAGIKSPDIDRLASAIGQSQTRHDLVAAAQSLDKALMEGSYVVPLFYLGQDMVAYTQDIKRPAQVPLYGIVIESFWHQETPSKH